MLDHILALIRENGLTRREVVELVIGILRAVGYTVQEGEWLDHFDSGGMLLYLKERRNDERETHGQ